MNSPAYKLSRFLATILKKAFNKPKFNVTNSTQLIRHIRHLRIKEGYKLVSYDVENCFGTIPTEHAIKIIQDEFDKVEPHTNIPCKEFMDLLRFCLCECNYFTFENALYKQVLGLFMGSSLSSILVERVIEKAVETTLEKLDFVPPFWKIYVDDHLTAIPEEKIYHVQNMLNEYLKGVIKFTVEVEENHQINSGFWILDLTIHVDDSGKMKTDWYAKPIASNRLINFYSAHPQHMKFNVAKSFIRKVLTVSHFDFHKANKVRIENILMKNNYPLLIIKKLIKQVENARHQNRSLTTTRSEMVPNKRKSYPLLLDETKTELSINKKTESYTSIAYVPRLSEEITKQLKYFLPDLKVAARPPQKLVQFYTKLKQPIKKEDLTGVVYQFPCEVGDTSYIGETVQKLGTRTGQHKNDCVEANLKKKSKNRTALATHVKETGHKFNFDMDKVKILKREKNKQKLQIQEINQIVMHEGEVCNFKSDSAVISPTYGLLLQQFKQRLIKLKPPDPVRRQRTHTASGFGTTSAH